MSQPGFLSWPGGRVCFRNQGGANQSIEKKLGNPAYLREFEVDSLV